MSLPQSSFLPVQLSPVSRNLSVIFHVTMVCNCFSPSISFTRLFLFWWQLLQLNSVNYFSWTSNFNHPPFLFFNNIWRRFFNFLGPFNYENLVHCYKFESPSESNDSPPLNVSLHFYSPPPSLPEAMALLVLRIGRMEEEKRAKSLYFATLHWKPLWQLHCTASPFGSWCLLHGLHSNTDSLAGTCGSLGKSWARPLVGTGISISLVRSQDSGFTGGSIPAPCLTQAWLHFPSLKPHAYDSFPSSLITWADICLCTNGCSTFEFSISTTGRKSDPVDLRKNPDMWILKNAHQISLYYELNCVPQAQIQMLKP